MKQEYLHNKKLCKGIHVYQVDGFTSVPFGGNPAGVVIDACGLNDELMQKIACEMNLSETAFVVDLRETKCESADFSVRFFTPESEVDLCGHATIGAFWLLGELGIVSLDENKKGEEFKVRVHQRTRAGILPVDVLFNDDGDVSRVMMTQSLPHVAFELESLEVKYLERILGVPVGGVTGFTAAKPQAISTGLLDLIVPVTSLDALFLMKPDMDRLLNFCIEKDIIGVHCFCLETVDKAATIHCRNFAPAVGITEEAATGTASGAAGCFLVLNDLIKINRSITRIICEQGHVMDRPSTIYIEVGLDGEDIISVSVGGHAFVVMEGFMKVFDGVL